MSNSRLAASLPHIPRIEEAMVRVDRQMQEWTVATEVPLLYRAVEQIFAARGKQLRAALTLAMAAAHKAEITDEVVTAAAAVELVHVGSLVHDDIMDNATERRGVRTVNADFGSSAALMVGDFLLARAGQAVISVSQQVANALVGAFVELTEGQTLEMLDAYDLDRTEQRALRSIQLKTGALFRAACTIGATCAGGDETQVAAAGDYGARLGEAFQVIDDLLDLTSTPELVGKPVGNDMRQGVYSLPLLRAMAGGRLPDVRATLAERRERLTAEEAFAIMARLRATDIVDDTFALATEQAQGAVAALAELPDGDARTALAEFPFSYLAWARSAVSPG